MDKKSRIYSPKQSKKFWQLWFLKREGLFNVFPSIGRKVIKSAIKGGFFLFVQVKQGNDKREKQKKNRSKRRLLVSAAENETRDNWIKSTLN